MSRAFVKEDSNERHRPFALPHPEDPKYNFAAAMALLDAAGDGETHLAEEATGYRWGEPTLFPHVRKLLQEAESLPEAQQDARYITLARRFLRG